MNKSDAVAVKYNDVLARVADLQSAFTIFQQQPDDAPNIKVLEDAKHGLMNTIIELDQSIFDLHYSLLMQGGGNLEPGSRSRRDDGDQPAD